MRLMIPLSLAILLLVSGCVSEPAVTEEQTVTQDWNPDGIISAGEYQYSQRLSDSMQIHWATTDTMIRLAVVGRTPGWVGIGFGTSRMNVGVDYIFGYPEGDDLVVQDMYGENPRCPMQPDSAIGGTDDILRYGGRQADGVTTIEFERLLNTGDSFDHILRFDEEIPIIWSLSDSASIGVQHRERGTTTIVLRR
ncbi:MAG: DOMON domain-containing protein [Methanocalculus sp.]|uniref:DOMON domain-containing protein n=1 Tax=Methanocalculus sp. TaxID=2004547 RepID=UPI002717BF09|nr:DOMON domain-containing protein [Methanocalculus sp.]MDO9539193.1 DOMON domain-containing protein [Methanocalculus sp.]